MTTVSQHTRKKVDFWSLSSTTMMKILIIFTLVTLTTLLHLTSALPGQKQVYMTRSGQEKVKRYLQRRHREFLDSQYPGGKRPQFYTNTWAVVVDPPTKEVADVIAKKHGFINIGKVKRIPYLNIMDILTAFTKIFTKCCKSAKVNNR